jgi:hypothetical protein
MTTTPAFISYVRENSEIIDRLADDLRSYGIKVWVDRDDIVPGQYWKDAIREAIHNGAYFIACFSQQLHKRQETYAHDELRLAIDRLRKMPRNRVWFIPVLIDDTDIPLHRISDDETLRDINAVRLFDDWHAGIQKLLRAMQVENSYHHTTPLDAETGQKDLQNAIHDYLTEVYQEFQKYGGNEYSFAMASDT